MFSKHKRHIQITSVAEFNNQPPGQSYPYDERMDELHRINQMEDRVERLTALKNFISAEWELLLKLGEPNSQALKSAKASTKYL